MPLRTGPFEDGRGGFYADCDVADTWGQTEREAIDALVLLLEHEIERLHDAQLVEALEKIATFDTHVGCCQIARAALDAAKGGK